MNIHGNVHQILKQFAKQKQQILDELQEQREETEKQLHQFDALQKSISASPVPDIVRFNVHNNWYIICCRLVVKFLQQIATHF